MTQGYIQHPFIKKELHEIKAPIMFDKRLVGTPVNKAYEAKLTDLTNTMVATSIWKKVKLI